MDKRILAIFDLVKATIDSIDEFVFIIDPSYTLHFINNPGKTILERFGITGDLPGKDIRTIFHFLPSQSWAEYKEVFDNRETLLTEESLIIDGELRFTRTRKLPVCDFEGNLFVITIINDITKDKEVLDLKDELENNYQQVIRNFPNGGILTYDKYLRYIIAGGAELDRIGFTQESLVGKTIYEIFEKDIIDQIERAYLDSLEGKETYLEVEFMGTWYSTINIPNRTKDGKIRSGMVMVQNITERKEADRKIHESESKFKNAFHTSPDSVNLNKMDGTYVEVNEGFTRLTGYTWDEVKGKTSEDIGIWANPEQRLKLIEGIQEKGFVENLEADFVLKNGDIRPGLMSARLIMLGGEPHLISITRSITELKTALQNLRDSEKKYRNTFDAINEGLWEWNLKSDTGLYSDSLYSMFGYQPGDFDNNNESWNKLIHPDDLNSYLDSVNNHIEGKTEEFIIEYRIKNKRGDWQWSRIKGKIMERDIDEKPLIILAAIENIDKIKRAELELFKKNEEFAEQNVLLKQRNEHIELMLEQLRQAKEKAEESDRLKSEFLNNMSHEIRTPMNGIIGFANLLENDELSNETRLNFSRIIKSSSHQLLRIIDDILEISTLETRQVTCREEEFSLNELLLEIFSVFKIRSENSQVHLFYYRGLPDNQSLILSDKTKIHKIISNLVENAFKFTTQGNIEIGYEVKDSKLEIYVKDSGVGISPENHEMIFQRFAQEEKEISSKKGGLGIGLSIARENALLLGGDIKVESDKGKGSVFTLIIPYKGIKKNIPESTGKGLDKTIVQNKYNVLVAEDEEINFLFISTLLEREFDLDFKIIHAKNGQEALDLFEKQDIDLILMDIKMPVMNGLEATRHLKNINPGIPIIALTAYSTSQDRSNALEAGCDEFISKPVDKVVLNKVIRDFLPG